MPWLNTGIFERFVGTSPNFSGNNVWQQDQSAGIKIVDARHDVHDQDIAAGITATVNLDGYTTMRANFDMGTFRIVNLADGIDAVDGVNKSQLDVVDAKADQNAIDIAAIQTSDPDSIITAVTWDDLDLIHTRANGDFTSALRRFDDFKSGGKLRHLGQNLTALLAPLTTDVDTNTGNRFQLTNNAIPGGIDLNIIRPVGTDNYLGPNYFVEGLVMIENLATPSLITLQADGVDVDPSDIIGAPTLSANTTYTLSYIIQYDNGTYREAYVWSAP